MYARSVFGPAPSGCIVLTTAWTQNPVLDQKEEVLNSMPRHILRSDSLIGVSSSCGFGILERPRCSVRRAAIFLWSSEISSSKLLILTV